MSRSPWSLMLELEEFARLQVKPDLVITLKVVDQEGRIVKHRMRATDRLQALMDKYYTEAPEVGYGTGTFLLDSSTRLRRDKTAAELRLEDRAQIDFFPYADGGGRESNDA